MVWGKYLSAGLAAVLLAGTLQAGERREGYAPMPLGRAIVEAERRWLSPLLQKNLDTVYRGIDAIVEEA
ncbi:hypothetical protein HYS48_02860, partial [Candidatus Woesearchaeota archaeon]|nr:hypothetical protein [Candidatus Woesearchaeota archaeon]